MQNFFIETSPAEDGIIRLSGADVNHMKNVLRMKPGELVQIQDGQGITYTCRISGYEDREAVLEILETKAADTELPSALYLFQGLPKGDKMEWIVQKAVELGAVRIVPFFSRYCVAAPKKEEQKNERYQRIAAEAAKQCGRGILPQVELPLDVAGVCARLSQFDQSFLFYEKGGQALRSCLGSGGRIALITGSEGGFSEQEAQALVEAGATVIGLGQRILRCETAPLAALSAVMTLTGNLE